MLNTSPDSLGINQRAHHSIDQFAAATAVPYSTIRPAILAARFMAPDRRRSAFRDLATEEALSKLESKGAESLWAWLVERYQELS